MGSIVNVIEETRSRVVAETAPTKLLEEIKTVLVGKHQAVDFDVDCPFIVIALEGGVTENFSGQNRKAADVSISITIIDKIEDERVENLYYNFGAGTGLLFLLEKTLDVIHQTSGGVFDPRLSQNSFESMGVSTGGELKFGESFMGITANLTLKTKEFIGNQRRV